MCKIIKKVKNRKVNDFKVNANGVSWCNDHLRVPKVDELRRLVLKKVHHLDYTIHLGSTNMYQDLKRLYWWDNLKKDVVDFGL